MYDTLTVAIPADLRATVAAICVEVGIIDAATDMPPAAWQGHGDDWTAMSGSETPERIGALLAAAHRDGVPLLILTPQVDEDGEPIQPPEPQAGHVLAMTGRDGLAALEAMGLERAAGEE